MIDSLITPNGTVYKYGYNLFGDLNHTDINGIQSINIIHGSWGVETGKPILKWVNLLDGSGDQIVYAYFYDEYGRLDSTHIDHPWGTDIIALDMDIADFTTEMRRSFTHTNGNEAFLITHLTSKTTYTTPMPISPMPTTTAKYISPTPKSFKP